MDSIRSAPWWKVGLWTFLIATTFAVGFATLDSDAARVAPPWEVLGLSAIRTVGLLSIFGVVLCLYERAYRVTLLRPGLRTLAIGFFIGYEATEFLGGLFGVG